VGGVALAIGLRGACARHGMLVSCMSIPSWMRRSTSVYGALGMLGLRSIAPKRSEPVRACACLDTREMWQWCADTSQQPDTECDSSSSDMDLDSPHPLPLAWEVLEVPRALTSDLVPIAMVHVRPPKTIKECTPSALLPAAQRFPRAQLPGACQASAHHWQRGFPARSRTHPSPAPTGSHLLVVAVASQLDAEASSVPWV
jgi:hypothetical protein